MEFDKKYNTLCEKHLVQNSAKILNEYIEVLFENTKGNIISYKSIEDWYEIELIFFKLG